MSILDEITHGTGIPIEKEAYVDMRDKIYRLDSAKNPLVVFLNMFQKVTAYNVKYDWLEREGFERRTFKGVWVYEADVSTGTDDVLGVMLNGRDWNAIAFIATALEAAYDSDVHDGHVRIHVTNQDGETAAANEVHVIGYLKRSAYENGHTQRKLTDSDGLLSTSYYVNTIQLSKDASSEATLILAANEAEVIIDSTLIDGSGTGTYVWNPAKITDGTECFVTVEFPNMQAKGHQQGTGLGKEVKNITRLNHNWTQIFKTPVSVTGSMNAQKMIGGAERLKRQFEAGKSHASDMEFALIFQGGGTEGAGGDWGMVVGGDNPKTVMKGLGVGHESGKEGFIVSNNGNPLANYPDPCTITTKDFNDWMMFMERIYDDMSNGSDAKVLFTSLKVIGDLSYLAMDGDCPFQLMNQAPYSDTIGINVRRVLTPYGTLDLVHHPMFNGPYHRYGLVIDPVNIALRPLNGRDTKLYLDVGAKELDGVVDQYLSEVGLEVRHEHTHAIMFLSDS